MARLVFIEVQRRLERVGVKPAWQGVGWLVTVYAAALLQRSHVWLPFSLDLVPMASFLMWCGYQSKGIDLSRLCRPAPFLAVAIIWALGVKLSDYEMATRVFLPFIPAVTTALVGTLMVSVFSCLLDRHLEIPSRALGWCGRESMAIYCVHALDGGVLGAIVAGLGYAGATWAWALNCLFRVCIDVAVAFACNKVKSRVAAGGMRRLFNAPKVVSHHDEVAKTNVKK